MAIDIDELREDMKDNNMGAFFVGGFGGALMENSEVDALSPEKLIEMARGEGIDLSKYRI